MASSKDLIRPLLDPMELAGFQQLAAPGMVTPPRTLWHLTTDLLSGADGITTVTVDVMPSATNPGMFVFNPTVLLDGKRLNKRIHPIPFWGTVAEFVDKHVPDYKIAVELESFYARGDYTPGVITEHSSNSEEDRLTTQTSRVSFK